MPRLLSDTTSPQSTVDAAELAKAVETVTLQGVPFPPAVNIKSVPRPKQTVRHYAGVISGSDAGEQEVQGVLSRFNHQNSWQ